MEKLILAVCVCVFSFIFIFDFIFPDQFNLFSSAFLYRYNIFRELRNEYNIISDRFEYVKKMETGDMENMENLFFSPIYKREYDELMALYKMDESIELSEQFSLCVLLSTIGDIKSEILRVKSDKPIASKGFIVSSKLSAVVGKILRSYGNTADIAPIWSDYFSSQVYVSSKREIDGLDNDLALIEKGVLINFNPALPYEGGDEIKIAAAEFGGYNLERYHLNKIGTVSKIKSTEIVERYEINFDFSREEILKNRYFFIIENIQ